MFKNINNQKGASIYFALDILAIMMAIVVGISSVIVVQLSNIKEAGDSVVAFYAADTGIERTLWEKRNNNPDPGFSADFFDEDLNIVASYYTTVNTSTTDPTCSATYYCIESIGKYESSDTRRGIRINR
ncbi:MAG: hypothetical protein PHS27_01540 [Candidatus Pacebacteria bacterium]|nr:hypothetical protein [Candidatus Paceibacterota bacterium]